MGAACTVERIAASIFDLQPELAIAAGRERRVAQQREAVALLIMQQIQIEETWRAVARCGQRIAAGQATILIVCGQQIEYRPAGLLGAAVVVEPQSGDGDTDFLCVIDRRVGQAQRELTWVAGFITAATATGSQ